uniref:Uncharacterized protein n=1 Tax=Moschus moschiferus TaxID=68415 RepID=A0A8C6CQJ4_MOSMO
MKGALLVLALLVTRELNFKTNEACPAFYAVLSALLVGSKTLLNSTLSLVEATDEEKAGFGKMQDCFNEDGFNAKLSCQTILEILDSLYQYIFLKLLITQNEMFSMSRVSCINRNTQST